MVGPGSQDGLLVRRIEVGEVVVDGGESLHPCFPSFPKTKARFGSRRHDASVDGLSSSSEQIFDGMFFVNWNKVQKAFCGGGMSWKIW